ncbi:hypothetical protein [Streptacidiphilus sp. BW17]|uniref:golvesin C-terminal-like domain-containing protein n=1 Tax=Streptacidiphilus sp. BW17 TaxID=3156274 RepID=UPI003516DD26
MTVSGDDNGLNVLVADESSGYQWRTAATLSEPGFDTDQWIGQSCVTSSGRRAVVVYAPRQFTNQSGVFNQGAFVAIVDLVTGDVRKLPFTASLAYYDPGCGAGEQVALSSLESVGGKAVSTVRVVDASTGKVLRETQSAGQLSSPVPFNGGVAAALGNRLVSIDTRGGEHTLAVEKDTPFRIHPDGAGGLAYQVPQGKNVQVRRFAAGKSQLVGTGALGQVQLTRSGNQVFVVGSNPGKALAAAKLPGGWQRLNAPVDSDVSTTGALAVTLSTNHLNQAKSSASSTKATDIPTLIGINALVTGTGKNVAFRIAPEALKSHAGLAASPALTQFGQIQASAASAAQTTTTTGTRSASAVKTASAVVHANAIDTGGDPSTETWDPDRGCAVPRNDPTIQTYQPTAAQVEWAADLAVQGQLTPSRAANWEGSGMPVSWTPQGMFPLQQLSGGGSVPAQVLLGVLAQESNTMQASPHAVDSTTGNFNQGGFYGNGGDWATVDCGYGIGQVTTGMSMNTPSGTPVADGNMAYTTAEQQQAIATDYASNIAASLNLLIDKWNQLKAAGIIAGNGDPSHVENWWFAVWAYNAGVEPGPTEGNTTGCTPSATCTDGSGNWGLGWANNPANPAYPADRGVFTNSTTDTKVPNHWTYPELVMGWAYSPVPRYNYATSAWGPAFTPAGGRTSPSEPAFMTFCTQVDDNCTPNAAPDSNGTANSAGLCGLSDYHCWWHKSTTWVDCTVSGNCGTSVLTYTSSSSKPLGTDIYPPDCRPLGDSSGDTNSDSTGQTPPTGSIVVDDVTTPSVASCNQTWTDQGSFGVKFTSITPNCGANGCADPIDYPGKIDFHQLGLGFGGHIWFTHTEPASDTADHIVGTWTPPALNGWTRIWVHIPDSGDTTREAPYTVNTGMSSGVTQETRYVDTRDNSNEWVQLGVFQFNSAGTENVQLTNTTPDGAGTDDIAWDAVAFQPLPTKPADFVVAMGDSYSSGEGNGTYYTNSDIDGANPSLRDNCHRSPDTWSRQAVLADSTSTIGLRADNGDNSMDYHLIACSGAQSFNLLSGTTIPNGPSSVPVNSTATPAKGVGQNGEVAQLDSGYLDANTTLVTISVGGNDSEFSSILQNCIFNIVNADCSSVTQTGDSEPLSAAEPARISGAVTQNIESVLSEISQEAPNAQIVLMGYPELFSDSGSCLAEKIGADEIAAYGILGPVGGVLATAANISASTHIATDAAWIDQMSDDLDQAMQNASNAENAQGVKVIFSDPRTVWADKGVCGSPQELNDFVLTKTAGEDPNSSNPVSQQSFHPTAAGALDYAGALNTTLRSLGM